MRYGTVLAAALVLSAGAARADDAAPPDAFAAVGRLTYGAIATPGAALCTATLVAPDLILTADHCIRARDGAPVDAGTIRFAAGWNGNLATVEGRGAAILGPDGGPVAQEAPVDMARDMALVRLAAPMAGIAPLPLTGADPGLPPYRLMAFRRDAPGAAVFADCRPVALGLPVIGLDCPVVSGNSGGPLMAEVDGRWHLLAIMVATNGEASTIRSLAVVPPDPLRDLLR